MNKTGLVTVVNERDQVLAKAIAMRGGENAERLAAIIRLLWPLSLEMFHKTALCFRFGGRSGLILVDRSTVLYTGDGELGSGRLYRLTFDNPRYCPPPFPDENNIQIITIRKN